MTTGPGPALDETAFGAWLDSLPETDEPVLICPNPDVHRGLYIARELCRANQASLEYVPVPGGGACFRIALPGPNGMLAV